MGLQKWECEQPPGFKIGDTKTCTLYCSNKKQGVVATCAYNRWTLDTTAPGAYEPWCGTCRVENVGNEQTSNFDGSWACGPSVVAKNCAPKCPNPKTIKGKLLCDYPKPDVSNKYKKKL